jgi:large subunit ribosomal protein L21
MSQTSTTPPLQQPAAGGEPAGSAVDSTAAAPSTAAAATPTPVAAAAGATAGDSQNGVYAIVEASGQQFWIQPNRYLDIDRLHAEVDSTVTLEQVLLVKDSSGTTTLGRPYVDGASVELRVMAHRRGPKVIVYKMRPKKKTRRKNGHRQELTRVMVESITVAGKALA